LRIGHAVKQACLEERLRMKRLAIAAGLTTVVMLSSCGKTEHEPSAEEAAASAADAAATEDQQTAPPVAQATAPEPAAPVLQPVLLPGAPTFAALYPGAQVQGDATDGQASDGQGGLVTFATQATPAEVVGFYRARAEEAGLSSVMAMTQGATHAYGARGAQSGASLSVVASPLDDQTNVQLSWSDGG
jgi:hypothetical protein